MEEGEDATWSGSGERRPSARSGRPVWRRGWGGSRRRRGRTGRRRGSATRAEAPWCATAAGGCRAASGRLFPRSRSEGSEGGEWGSRPRSRLDREGGTAWGGGEVRVVGLGFDQGGGVMGGSGVAGWAFVQLGRWSNGPASWVGWPGGGGLFLFLFLFVFCFLLLFLSFLFKSFKSFSHFIKRCLLPHNYLCNIWRPPNIFVSILKTFIVLTLIQI